MVTPTAPEKDRSGPCTALVSRGGRCSCRLYANAGTSGGYPVCACSHTVHVHTLMEVAHA